MNRVSRFFFFSRVGLSMVVGAQVVLADTARAFGLPSVLARPLYFIQDIHEHAQAQQDIAAQLQALQQKKGGILRVAVEGAAGPADFSGYWAFPDRSLTQSVISEFFQEQRISGPVYAAASSQRIHLIGIEDPLLYRENVKSCQKALSVQDKLLSQLKQREKRLNVALAQAHPSLHALHENIQAYRGGALPFPEYLVLLTKESDLFSWAAEHYLATWNLEKQLSMEAVASERERFLRHISPLLTERDRDALSAHTSVFSAARYEALFAWARSKNISVHSYPHLTRYVQYLKMAENIDAEALLYDARALEKAAYLRHARTAKDRLWVEENRVLQLQKKLAAFQLLPDEWMDLKRAGPPAAETKPFYAFYQWADQRSAAMVERLVKKPVDAVVVGGFHAQEMVAALKKKGYAPVLIRPSIQHIDLEKSSAYLSAFAQKKTPLQRLFSGRRLFLALPLEMGFRRPLVPREWEPISAEFIARVMDRVPPALLAKTKQAATVLKKTTQWENPWVKETTYNLLLAIALIQPSAGGMGMGMGYAIAVFGFVFEGHRKIDAALSSMGWRKVKFERLVWAHLFIVFQIGMGKLLLMVGAPAWVAMFGSLIAVSLVHFFNHWYVDHISLLPHWARFLPILKMSGAPPSPPSPLRRYFDDLQKSSLESLQAKKSNRFTELQEILEISDISASGMADFYCDMRQRIKAHSNLVGELEDAFVSAWVIRIRKEIAENRSLVEVERELRKKESPFPLLTRVYACYFSVEDKDNLLVYSLIRPWFKSIFTDENTRVFFDGLEKKVRKSDPEFVDITEAEIICNTVALAYDIVKAESERRAIVRAVLEKFDKEMVRSWIRKLSIFVRGSNVHTFAVARAVIEDSFDRVKSNPEEIERVGYAIGVALWIATRFPDDTSKSLLLFQDVCMRLESLQSQSPWGIIIAADMDRWARDLQYDENKIALMRTKWLGQFYSGDPIVFLSWAANFYVTNSAATREFFFQVKAFLREKEPQALILPDQSQQDFNRHTLVIDLAHLKSGGESPFLASFFSPDSDSKELCGRAAPLIDRMFELAQRAKWSDSFESVFDAAMQVLIRQMDSFSSDQVQAVSTALLEALEKHVQLAAPSSRERNFLRRVFINTARSLVDVCVEKEVPGVMSRLAKAMDAHAPDQPEAVRARLLASWEGGDTSGPFARSLGESVLRTGYVYSRTSVEQADYLEYMKTIDRYVTILIHNQQFHLAESLCAYLLTVFDRENGLRERAGPVFIQAVRYKRALMAVIAHPNAPSYDESVHSGLAMRDAYFESRYCRVVDQERMRSLHGVAMDTIQNPEQRDMENFLTSVELSQFSPFITEWQKIIDAAINNEDASTLADQLVAFFLSIGHLNVELLRYGADYLRWDRLTGSMKTDLVQAYQIAGRQKIQSTLGFFLNSRIIITTITGEPLFPNSAPTSDDFSDLAFVRRVMGEAGRFEMPLGEVMLFLLMSMDKSNAIEVIKCLVRFGFPSAVIPSIKRERKDQLETAIAISDEPEFLTLLAHVADIRDVTKSNYPVLCWLACLYFRAPPEDLAAPKSIFTFKKMMGVIRKHEGPGDEKGTSFFDAAETIFIHGYPLPLHYFLLLLKKNIDPASPIDTSSEKIYATLVKGVDPEGTTESRSLASVAFQEMDVTRRKEIFSAYPPFLAMLMESASQFGPKEASQAREFIDELGGSRIGHEIRFYTSLAQFIGDKNWSGLMGWVPSSFDAAAAVEGDLEMWKMLAALRSEDPERAIFFLKRALSLHSTWPDGYAAYRLGFSLERSGWIKKAVFELTEVLLANSEFFSALSPQQATRLLLMVAAQGDIDMIIALDARRAAFPIVEALYQNGLMRRVEESLSSAAWERRSHAAMKWDKNRAVQMRDQAIKGNPPDEKNIRARFEEAKQQATLVETAQKRYEEWKFGECIELLKTAKEVTKEVGALKEKAVDAHVIWESYQKAGPTEGLKFAPAADEDKVIQRLRTYLGVVTRLQQALENGKLNTAEEALQEAMSREKRPRDVIDEALKNRSSALEAAKIRWDAKKEAVLRAIQGGEPIRGINPETRASEGKGVDIQGLIADALSTHQESADLFDAIEAELQEMARAKDPARAEAIVPHLVVALENAPDSSFSWKKQTPVPVAAPPSAKGGKGKSVPKPEPKAADPRLAQVDAGAERRAHAERAEQLRALTRARTVFNHLRQQRVMLRLVWEAKLNQQKRSSTNNQDVAAQVFRFGAGTTVNQGKIRASAIQRSVGKNKWEDVTIGAQQESWFQTGTPFFMQMASADTNAPTLVPLTVSRLVKDDRRPYVEFTVERGQASLAIIPPNAEFRYLGDPLLAQHINGLKRGMDELQTVIDADGKVASQSPVIELLGVKRTAAPRLTPAAPAEMNPEQKDAYEAGVNPAIRIVAVQGPPGTGKTYVSSKLIQEALENNRVVIVIAQAHAALDNLGKVLLDTLGKSMTGFVVKLARLGSDSVAAFISERLQPHHTQRIDLLLQGIEDHAAGRAGFVALVTNNGYWGDRNSRVLLSMYLSGEPLNEIREQAARFKEKTANVKELREQLRKHNPEDEKKRPAIKPVVVQEEAGQASAAETLAGLSYFDPEKIIMVGDQKQLPPYGLSQEYLALLWTELRVEGFDPKNEAVDLDALKEARTTDKKNGFIKKEYLEAVGVSFFGMVHNYGTFWNTLKREHVHGVATFMLRVARRFPWVITLFVGWIAYGGKLLFRKAPSEEPIQADTLLFVQTSGKEGKPWWRRDNSGWMNEQEASQVIQAINEYRKEGMAAKEILVTSPYKAQVELIKRRLVLMTVLTALQNKEVVPDKWLMQAADIVKEKPVNLGARAEEILDSLSMPPDFQITFEDIALITLEDEAKATEKEAETDEESESLEVREINALPVRTVHSVQGWEKKVVILSLVREGNNGFGFMEDGQQGVPILNVAASRAQKHLIVIHSGKTLPPAMERAREKMKEHGVTVHSYSTFPSAAERKERRDYSDGAFLPYIASLDVANLDDARSAA